MWIVKVDYCISPCYNISCMDKKIAIVTFTCLRDAGLAAAFQYNVPETYKGYKIDRVWSFESKDAEVPIPDGVIRHVDKGLFNKRGYNLKGAQSVAGQAEIYYELAKEYDYVIKMDSDTVVWDWDRLIGGLVDGKNDFVYIKRNLNENGPLRCNGCCYAMSRAIINRMVDIPSAQWDDILINKSANGAEDLFFSQLLTAQDDYSFMAISKMKVWWCCAPYREADCILAHFGYISLNTSIANVNAINKAKGLPPFEKPAWFDEYINTLLKFGVEKNRKADIDNFLKKKDRYSWAGVDLEAQSDAGKKVRLPDGRIAVIQ